MERAKAVPDLLAAAQDRAGRDGAARWAAILGWTIDEKGLDPLVAMLDTLQPAGKAAALGVIGSKSGKRFAPRVLPAHLRRATPRFAPPPSRRLRGRRRARAPAGAPQDARWLGGTQPTAQPATRPAVTAGDAVYVADMQRAVVAAASQVTPEEARATPVLAAMKTAAHPERFVEVLPQVGGKQALAALVELFDGSNLALKAAAFRGLAQWRGPEAADRLFDIYADAGFRDQAFAGFLRQMSSSPLPDEQKVLQFRKALALNPPARERRQLIRALERAKTFQSFLVAASYLDDADCAATRPAR